MTEGTDEHRFFRKGRKRVITQLRKYVHRFYVNTNGEPLTLLQQKTWLLGSKPCVQLYVLKRLIDRVDSNRETPLDDVGWRPIETEFIAKVKQDGTAERQFFLNMTEGPASKLQSPASKGREAYEEGGGGPEGCRP